MQSGVSPSLSLSQPRPGMLMASAPGSMMITGEHAVLRGYPALACAVQQRVRVHLTPRTDYVVRFVSILGRCEMPLDRIRTDPPFSFAAAAARDAAIGGVSSGYDLLIEADMPPDVGLGSSAAVTVATYAAVHAKVHGRLPAMELLWSRCLGVIREIQGGGSGTDVAASVYGGMVSYTQAAGVLERFVSFSSQLSLFYVGYKTPTAEVLAWMAQRRAQHPAAFAALDARMGQCSEDAADAIGRGDAHALAKAMQDGQDVMEEYGLCDKTLTKLMQALRLIDGVEAVKISGSGLGDCVLVLGALQVPGDFPFAQIPVALDTEGVKVEVK